MMVLKRKRFMRVGSKLFKISYKLSIMIILMVVICSVFVGFFVYRRVAEDFFQARGMTAQMMASSLASALDPAEIQTILDTEEKNEYYEYIKATIRETGVRMPHIEYSYLMSMRDPFFYIIYAQNAQGDYVEELGFLYPLEDWNEAAISANTDGVHTYSEPYEVPGYGSFISGYAPIVSSTGNVIAIVGFDLPLNEIIAELDAIRNSIIIIIITFLLFFVVITLFITNRYISRPLTLLSDVSNKIASGDIDGYIPDVKTNDEIGLLVKNFKHAQSVIYSVNDEITKLAASLGKGELSMSIDVSKFDGGWHMLINNMNNLLNVIERSQENLRKARDMAEAANKSKSIFLANMSHEIRTPMNSIIGFAELAQDDDIPDNTMQYLTSIVDNGKWLLNIVNDILDNAKIESDKMVLESIPFDLKDVLSQCQSVMQLKVEEKGLTFLCYAQQFEGKKLMGDPVRLRQVLVNLLANAVKFTDKGAVELLALKEHTGEKQATVCFEVNDTGIGMDAEQVAKIFEPFKQADDTITRKFGGTGLGLTISKNIIKLMGGVLSVESTPGEGSRFSFNLTFDLIDDADVPDSNVIIKDLKKPIFSGEVLVCEDNGLNQQVICKHLERVGLTAVVAHDGKEGVELVQARLNDSAKPFDLIFMDIHMPVMDGLEASAKISEMGVNTPIVALTANIMSDDLDIYKTSGMPDYLGKPFTSQELWKCLIKYLPVTSVSDMDKNQLSFDDAEALKQLQLYFVKSNQDMFAKIKQAVDSGDFKLAHRLTHTLKSNAGQIGEKQLQDAAGVVEDGLEAAEDCSAGEADSAAAGAVTAGAANSVAAVTAEQMRELETVLKAVLYRLAPLMDDAGKQSSDTDISKDEALKMLDELEPMLIKSNPECMYLIDKIRCIPGAERLAGYVEDFNFNQALDELSNIRESFGVQ